MKYIIVSITLMLLLLTQQSESQALSKTFLWTAPTQNTDGTVAVVEGYNFYRSVDNGVTFTKLLSTGALITTATDSNVATGPVCYQVTGFNSIGESAASNRLCFQMPTAAPKAPSNLR